MWFIELGLRTYFILKRDRFLTTAIFTGSASTVQNSFEIMFQTAAYSLSGIRSYISCSNRGENPAIGQFFRGSLP